MPIVHMAFKAEDVPAGAENVRDASAQWKIPIWLYDTHQGFCLQDREENGRDDSDFYMVVWNPDKKEPEKKYFGTTRSWSYPTLASHVDATPEVRAAYEEWSTERNREIRQAEQERQARIPGRGKTLKVVKGRKVPKGTVGVCIWTGNGHWGERVGLKTEAGEVHWTAMSNVEVVLAKAA
jgi:hypothetical protein